MTVRRRADQIAVLAAAIGGGLLLDRAFPSIAWWPAAPLAVGVFTLVTTRGGIGANTIAGFAYGTAFSLVNLSWATSWAEAAGPAPWIGLSALMGAWYAVAAALGSWLTRRLPARWTSTGSAAVLASIWVLRESAMARYPLGGFGWSEIAISMIDSGISDLYPWLGTPAVTLIMVFVVAWVAVNLRDGWHAPTRLLAPVAAGLAFACVAAITPSWSAQFSEKPTIRVMAVQGNTRSGYFDDAGAPGSILSQQLRTTTSARGGAVDVLLWPEGASDLDPLRDPGAAAAFDAAAASVDAPLLGWAITSVVDPATGRPTESNTSLLWTVERGAIAHYDKRRPVPFGEYLPFRDAIEIVAPDIAALIGRDYTPGSTTPVIEIPRAIPARAGVAICFDLVDDELFWEMVDGGAEVVLIPSNNADFRGTDQSAQQLALARVRAVELGRAVLNASTVGVTASIAPDGSVVERLPSYHPGALIADLPMIDSLSPAAATHGSVGVVAAVLVIYGSLIIARRRPRRAHHAGGFESL